jgi:hypothetical protein
MTGPVTNRLERMWSWPGLKYYPSMHLKGMRTRKTSVRIVDVWAKIRTGLLSNISDQLGIFPEFKKKRTEIPGNTYMETCVCSFRHLEQN